MSDVYKNFQDLARNEKEGIDYSISFVGRGHKLIVVAPHAGVIEVGTSEISALIARDDLSLYRFESHKIVDENYVSLHITSHIFDEPTCINVVKAHDTVVTIHGCNDAEEIVFLGGLDKRLIDIIAESIRSTGMEVRTVGHRFPGKHHNNICNRGRSGMGVQIELSEPLRRLENRLPIACAIRTCLEKFLDNQANQ
ncbi:MAG: poly-gamma-glutamate hydrolase family protein [Gammaproteobacteria bacterium]